MAIFRSFCFSLAAVTCCQAASIAQGNILLIIADDIGVDGVGAYGEHADPGRTPVIDGLAER